MSRTGTPPLRDVALMVELGRRVCEQLMTEKDWSEALDRVLDTPKGGG